MSDGSRLADEMDKIYWWERCRELERELTEARSTIKGLRNPPSCRKMDMTDEEYIWSLEQRLAAAERDSERLDWMIRKRFRINPEIINGDGPFWTILKSRDAIDAAMQEGE